MNKRRMIVAAHLLLVFVAYTSWLWADWRIISAVAGLHIMMLIALKGCPLSHAQFPGEKDKRFYEWWMPKLGVKITIDNRDRLRFFMQYVLPVIIVTLAILLQELFEINPLISLG